MQAVARHRLVRFSMTGLLCALVQLGLLHALLDAGAPALLANPGAFLLSAQVNFMLSLSFTWRDRPVEERIMARWLAFLATVSSAALVNLGVFAAARVVMPDLLAAAAGIGVTATVNFILGDRVVFASPRASARSRTPRPFATQGTGVR